ncbi:MAG: molybdopterin converting factor [Planctomycetota bacterium]|nr:MAG: molybdopterin converting factor [Planctomycetota bacterium]
MQIMYINNAGGGFANYMDIEENTSIETLFSQKMPNEESHDYLIRVNRQPVPKDYCLKENDRVTITPTKIDGARPVLQNRPRH